MQNLMYMAGRLMPRGKEGWCLSLGYGIHCQGLPNEYLLDGNDLPLLGGAYNLKDHYNAGSGLLIGGARKREPGTGNPEVTLS